jgi:hypothetical protein
MGNFVKGGLPVGQQKRPGSIRILGGRSLAADRV